MCRCDGQRVQRKRFKIGHQPQKTQLCDAAKENTARFSAFHPRLGRSMMLLRFKCQCQPEINIGQEHVNRDSSLRCPLHPESQRFAHSSDGRFQVPTTERGGTQHASDSWQNEPREMSGHSRLPQFLRETTLARQTRPHHFVYVLGFSRTNYGAVFKQSQCLLRRDSAKEDFDE